MRVPCPLHLIATCSCCLHPYAPLAGVSCPARVQVVRIAGEMLGVLEYLSSLRPPVIHRVRLGEACRLTGW